MLGFVGALSMPAKKRTPPEGPSAEGPMETRGHIHSGLKRSELPGHENSRRDLKCMLLSYGSLFGGRETNPTRLQTVWFQLRDIPEKIKL